MSLSEMTSSFYRLLLAVEFMTLAVNDYELLAVLGSEKREINPRFCPLITTFFYFIKIKVYSWQLLQI
jgi:hypothetical protein